MSKWVWRLGCLMPLLVVTVGLVAILATVLNNELQIDEYAAELFAYPVPPESQIITRATVRSEASASNGCGYQPTLTLFTELSRGELLAHYQANLSGILSRPASVYVRMEALGPNVSTQWAEVVYGDFGLWLYDMRC